MEAQPMECGGCAAKLGAASLARALERLGPGRADASVVLGLAEGDDAAAWRAAGGDVVLASVDGFRAFCDDPFLVGRVAAVNAASDVFAKGGRPRHALALVTLPAESEARAQETLYQVLCGVRAALEPLGVALVGGHTTAGPELFVALSVSGELAAGDAVLPLGGARPGDRLVLSKALGTGVVLAADAQGLAAGAWLVAAHASMLRSNADAARIARALGAGACTDVTGFGLAGHLANLLRASGVSARLRLEALPALDGAVALLARGVRSSFHAQNAASRGALAFGARAAGSPAAELVFDPQTSGGLLFALAPARAAEALAALREAGDAAAADIGLVTPPRPDAAVFALE
jgi:selenide,water dikinase